MGKLIDGRKIIWPNRFDLLVRIDFLEWFESVGRYYLSESNSSTITNDLLTSNPEFLIRAKQHPYFIQYTKLKRKYRLRNLTYQEAEAVYAEGIVGFIKLNESIKANSFDFKKRITLNKPLLKIRKHYIGDGCHRFACLVWSSREFLIPSDFFRLRYKLIYKPANSNLTAGYRRLGILTEEHARHFDTIFGGSNLPKWDPMLQWLSEIRERFKNMDIEAMYKREFRRLDFE
jgi:hypothetical protein